MFRSCTRLATRHRGFLPRFFSSDSVEDGRWPGWEVVIGLEVHAQIKSHAKLFSRQNVFYLLIENDVITALQTPGPQLMMKRRILMSMYLTRLSLAHSQYAASIFLLESTVINAS